jgi:hypothetical protein
LLPLLLLLLLHWLRLWRLLHRKVGCSRYTAATCRPIDGWQRALLPACVEQVTNTAGRGRSGCRLARRGAGWRHCNHRRPTAAAGIGHPQRLQRLRFWWFHWVV